MRTPTVVIPAGAEGVDFASWRPTSVEVRRWAYVLRYMGAGSAWKLLTPAEIATYHAAGVAIVMTLEQAADSWTKGANLGRLHGRAAATEAARLGYPKGLPIPMAYDTNVPSLAAETGKDATPAQRAEAVRLRQVARAYGDAAADELEAGGYSLGVYGDVDVILLLQDRSHLNWLAGAAAWSDPSKPYQPETMPGYELVHIRQIISGSTPNYDRNITLRPFQAWLPRDVTDVPTDHVETPRADLHATTPATAASPQEDRMDFFTHSDNDHEDHPPRWTFWALMPDGTKRHASGLEVDSIRRVDRGSVPALTMAEIDSIPDYAAPTATALAGLHLTGTVDVRSAG